MVLVVEAGPDVRVGLDGFNLALPRGTGVATYGRVLSHALRGLGRSIDVIYGLDVPKRTPEPLRETLFFARLAEGAGREAGGKVTLRQAARRVFLSPGAREPLEIPVAGRVVREGLAQRLPAFDRLFTLGGLFHLGARHFRRYGRFMTVRLPDPPAIMHWTYPLPLRLEGALNVYTVHDLVPLRLPFTTLDDKAYHERLIRRCLATADHVVTVSEASRRDILDLFSVDPGRVTNTYQSSLAPAPLDATALTARLRTLFDLQPQGYFLFFGAIEPKKNVGRLIEAYLAAETATPLVLVGPRAWLADEELRLLDGAYGARLPGAERIRRIDYLPADHLRTLVQGARAVLFPSLYEGFGLPALEAMTLGAPVMAGDTAALPEVVGAAGRLVDPYDVAAMAGALRELDGDDALRARLGAAGRERAALFSLDAYQDRLAALHARLLDPAASRLRGAPLSGDVP
ncbi:glycosyltransferase family 4 protein [Caulobacter soli]|uniref:glycosyltransferase family 4 protein n=1 Tax=Caulobacter soli TaxID=2708539 RepID=UPI0013EA5DD5|nr:glycosyltransferase family 1 protein [Caulobacter soli]